MLVLGGSGGGGLAMPGAERVAERALGGAGGRAGEERWRRRRPVNAGAAWQNWAELCLLVNSAGEKKLTTLRAFVSSAVGEDGDVDGRGDDGRMTTAMHSGRMRRRRRMSSQGGWGKGEGDAREKDGHGDVGEVSVAGRPAPAVIAAAVLLWYY